MFLADLSADLIGLALVFLCIQDGTLVSRFFSLPPLVTLGRLSYCIYIVNIPVFIVVERLLMESTRVNPGLAAFPQGRMWLESCGICLLVIGLAAIWDVVERPIRRLRESLRR